MRYLLVAVLAIAVPVSAQEFSREEWNKVFSEAQKLGQDAGITTFTSEQGDEITFPLYSRMYTVGIPSTGGIQVRSWVFENFAHEPVEKKVTVLIDSDQDGRIEFGSGPEGLYAKEYTSSSAQQVLQDIFDDGVFGLFAIVQNAIGDEAR
jgi:hypothetical protein